MEIFSYGNAETSSLRGESVTKRKAKLNCWKFREEGVNNLPPAGEKTFVAPDRLKIFLLKLVASVQKIY